MSLPSTNSVYDQRQDDIKMQEEEEDAMEVGNDTAVDVSTDRNEETGMENRDGTRGAPDLYLYCGVEYEDNGVNDRQSILPNHPEYEEERNDLRDLQNTHAKDQRDEGKTVPGDEEDMEVNEEAEDQPEKRETSSRETQSEQSVERGKRRETPETQSPDRAAECQDDEDNVRQNINNNLGGTQEVEQDDLKPVSVEEQGDGARTEIEMKVDKEGKSGANESGKDSESGKRRETSETQPRSQSTFSPQVQYHGLSNQGATCYLNSVLQVLFMSKGFRAAVKRHTCENPDTEHIDHHLASLFDDLNEGLAYTYNITRKLGIDRVYEQGDAAEYFEKILSLTSHDASQIFRGELTQKTTCSGCGTETDNDGGFWHLPLALVDSYSEHYSVVDGIEEYFRALDLCGENQMYCDQCDDKSDATIKCVIKHHPEVLMLLLKRFEFDYCYMMYVKINRTVDVPYTLQIPENQTYELYAFVEHFGDLRSGHYTATIKDDEKWYNFNDHKVTLLGFQPFQVDNSERSNSAYLLFYRKTKVRAANTCTPDIREVSPPGGLLPPTNSIHDQRQDTGKMKEAEEAEEAVKVGNDTVVAVSIDRNEETQMKDIVGTRGVGLSPDLDNNVENEDNGVNDRQSILYNHQEYEEDLHHPQNAHAKEQRDEGKTIPDDEEDMEVNAEAEDQPEKREIPSGETQPEESVEVQDNDRGRQRTSDISHDFNLPVSDRCNLSKQDEISNAQSRVMHVKTDKDGETEDDEQSKRKGRSLTKYPDHAAEFQQVNEEAEDQPEKRETPSGEIQSEESVEAQGNDSGRQRTPDLSHDFKLQVSESCNLSKQDEMSDAQSRVIHVKTDKDGETGYDEQSEKKERSLIKYPDRAEECQDDEDNVRQNTNNNLGGTQKVGQDYLKPVRVEEQGDRARTEKEMKVHKKGKSGADERGKAPERRKLLKIYDLLSPKIQDSGRVADSEENMSKNDQRCKQGGSRRYKCHEEQREEKRDVQGVKDSLGATEEVGQDDLKPVSVEEQGDRSRMEKGMKVHKEGKSGADERGKAPERRKLLKIYDLLSPKIQDSGRVADSEENMSKNDQRCKQGGSRRYKCHEEQREEKRDVQGVKEQKRGDSQQHCGSTEKMRKEDCQPIARPEFNEGKVEGRRGSNKSRKYYVKITEEEIKETPTGTQRSSKTTHIRAERVEETSEKDNLSEGFRKLELEPKRHITKRHIENAEEEDKTNSTIDSNVKKAKSA